MEELQGGPSLLELTFFQNPPQKALSWQVAGVSINAGKKKKQKKQNLHLISLPGMTSAPIDL